MAYLNEFERVIELVAANQKLGTPGEDDMRIYPFKRFPYSIVYREDPLAGPQVYAVAHQHRDPGYWRERM